MESDSGFRGERFDSGFRGGRLGLSWGAIRVFVRSDSGFRGERVGLSWGTIWAFVGNDSGFRRERFGFSWGASRAFVGSDSDFRGEGFGFSWERFGFSWEGSRALRGEPFGFLWGDVRGFGFSRGGFRWFCREGFKISWGGIVRNRASRRQRSQLELIGPTKPILMASRSIDNLCEFSLQAKNFKTKDQGSPLKAGVGLGATLPPTANEHLPKTSLHSEASEIILEFCWKRRRYETSDLTRLGSRAAP